VLTDKINIAPNDQHLFVPYEVIYLPSESIGVAQIVSIHTGYEIRRSGLDTFVESRYDTSSFAGQENNSFVN
jgi:hypothetical protein